MMPLTFFMGVIHFPRNIPRIKFLSPFVFSLKISIFLFSLFLLIFYDSLLFSFFHLRPFTIPFQSLFSLFLFSLGFLSCLLFSILFPVPSSSVPLPFFFLSTSLSFSHFCLNRLLLFTLFPLFVPPFLFPSSYPFTISFL